MLCTSYESRTSGSLESMTRDSGYRRDGKGKFFLAL